MAQRLGIVICDTLAQKFNKWNGFLLLFRVDIKRKSSVVEISMVIETKINKPLKVVVITRVCKNSWLPMRLMNDVKYFHWQNFWWRLIERDKQRFFLRFPLIDCHKLRAVSSTRFVKSPESEIKVSHLNHAQNSISRWWFYL